MLASKAGVATFHFSTGADFIEIGSLDVVKFKQTLQGTQRMTTNFEGTKYSALVYVKYTSCFSVIYTMWINVILVCVIQCVGNDHNILGNPIAFSTWEAPKDGHRLYLSYCYLYKYVDPDMEPPPINQFINSSSSSRIVRSFEVMKVVVPPEIIGIKQQYQQWHKKTGWRFKAFCCLWMCNTSPSLVLDNQVNMNFQAIWLNVSSEFAPVIHAFNRIIGVEGQLKNSVCF